MNDKMKLCLIRDRFYIEYSGDPVLYREVQIDRGRLNFITNWTSFEPDRVWDDVDIVEAMMLISEFKDVVTE